MAATTGTGSRSRSRSWALKRSALRKVSSSPFLMPRSSLRSPPAMKVFLAEVKTTPFRPGSFRSRSMTPDMAGYQAAPSVFASCPCMSIVTVTMPSASLS
jgi:hypothetical protein